MAKAEISWKRVNEDDVPIQVYVQHVGRDWLASAEVLVGVDLVFLEVEVRAGRSQDLDRLRDYLLARAVAWQHRDFRHEAGAASGARSRSL